MLGDGERVPSVINDTDRLVSVCVCVCASLTLVADEAHPAIRAITATFPLVTFPPVGTVVTG